MDGSVISFRARIHTVRRLSAKLVFIVFRQQTITIQGVLQSFKPIHELTSMQTRIPGKERPHTDHFLRERR